MNKQKPKVFISHSWEDNEIARKLAEYLRRDGAEVWIDYARIKGGDSLPEIISNAIDWCDTLILVWSRSALDSYWVKEEWTCAHTLKKRIIPCLIDRAKLPSILMSRLNIDIKDFDVGYRSLTRDLNLIVKAEKPKESENDVETQPKKAVPKPEIIKPEITIFRSKAKELSEAAVKAMLKKYGFFDRDYNENGKGFNHHYEAKTINRDKVVFDHASGLMWQQSGSENFLNYEDAKNWIKELNQKGFAGFSDWRLPTLEEAMSLMERNQKNDRYIRAIFDRKQGWIWTADQVKGATLAWVVSFPGGSCDHYRFESTLSVRVVRFGQSATTD